MMSFRISPDTGICFWVYLHLLWVCSQALAVNPGQAIPIFKASLESSGKPATWSAPCFATNAGYIKDFSGKGAVIEIQVADKVDWDCSDIYVIADRETFYVKEFFFAGAHTIEIDSWRTWEQEDVAKNGIQVFSVTNDTIGELEDLYGFADMFSDSWGVPEDPHVIAYMRDFMHWNLTARPVGKRYAKLNKTDIKNGDYLAILHYSGQDLLIMVGTGGHTGHTAVALWVEEELYICESTNPNIICSTWEEYITGWAENMTKGVAILRLAPEYQTLFNATAAYGWIKQVLGLPYGFQNFIFGWIDTAKDNYPDQLSEQFLTVIMPFVDEVAPELSILWHDALNLRMGTEGLSTLEIFHLLDVKNMTFGELMSIPEQDSWVYPSIPAPGKSMVCDVFVLNVYKAAGIFTQTPKGDLTNQFNSVELTPKDSYQLKIWDNNWEMPKPCYQAGDNLPYCQVLGEFVLELPGWNTIEPYPHMDEKCGALPPTYVRLPEGC